MTLCRPGLILLALTALASVGCVRPHGPENVRRDLAQAAGVRLDREMGVTVGRSGVWLARKIMKWSGETEIPLKGVRKVQVGVYEVQGLRRGHSEPANLAPSVLPGWQPLVRVREGDEQVLVMTHDGKHGIDRMIVVVAEDDEWVVVRLLGRLDRVLEEAMAYAFEEVDRPELYERTRERRGLGDEDPGGEESLDEDPEAVDSVGVEDVAVS